jgi:hypothetical protein
VSEATDPDRFFTEVIHWTPLQQTNDDRNSLVFSPDVAPYYVRGSGDDFLEWGEGHHRRTHMVSIPL